MYTQSNIGFLWQQVKHMSCRQLAKCLSIIGILYTVRRSSQDSGYGLLSLRYATNLFAAMPIMKKSCMKLHAGPKFLLRSNWALQRPLAALIYELYT